MTDDKEKIISSGTPHEVHLPEGSLTAVHKTAVPMEPTIRNTVANPDAEVELVEIVAGVSQSPETPKHEGHDSASAEPPDRFVSAPDDAAEDRMVSAPADAPAEHGVSDSAQAPHSEDAPPAVPLAQVMGELPSLELGGADASTAPEDSPAATQEAPAEVDTSDKAAEVAAAAAYMEEMNFPARVVKLKIANDQIRGQIEKLEKPLLPPVPVEAPAAAKGKDKEPAKKPAKGH